MLEILIMDAFELSEILVHSKLWKFFLSVGIYHLEAGGKDPQEPHTEDEVYFIVSGKAGLRCGTQDLAVMSGSIVIVPAGLHHSFYNV